MTRTIEKLTVISEFGDRQHPSDLGISMDGSQPDCPITFWQDGKAVFSMGADEIGEFKAALDRLDPNL